MDQGLEGEKWRRFHFGDMMSSDSWCHKQKQSWCTRTQNSNWHKSCESSPTRMFYPFEILYIVTCCSSTKRSPFKIKAFGGSCEDTKEQPWKSSSVCSWRFWHRFPDFTLVPFVDHFFYDWASGFIWSLAGNLFKANVLWLCMNYTTRFPSLVLDQHCNRHTTPRSSVLPSITHPLLSESSVHWLIS